MICQQHQQQQQQHQHAECALEVEGKSLCCNYLRMLDNAASKQALSTIIIQHEFGIYYSLIVHPAAAAEARSE